MAAAVEVSGRWTRLRTLGRGASGAVVSLAADAASGQLFAVKSAPAGTPAAAALRRERAVMSELSSPHVLRCIGASGDAADAYHLFLEYAPGGSLADAARGDERGVAAYAADVLRGLAYLHARGVVHGDVKPRNVVVGADGRAKLADFGCARVLAASGAQAPMIIGGTPAFMAPEVARGEEQGPAADVWAVGCTVLELATGRSPWSGYDVLAAMHRIGYTDAVPEVPAWMSKEARHFLARCFARNPSDRPAAADLLEHPFVAEATSSDAKPEVRWVSPKSTLDAAFWESESETDEEEEEEVPVPESSPAERIKSLAACSSLPEDWDCDDDESWIDVRGEEAVHVDATPSGNVSCTAGMPAGPEMVVVGGVVVSCDDHDDDEQLEPEGALLPFGAVAGAAAGTSDGGPSSVGRQESKRCESSDEGHVLLQVVVPFGRVVNIVLHEENGGVDAIKLWLTTNLVSVFRFPRSFCFTLLLLGPSNVNITSYE